MSSSALVFGALQVFVVTCVCSGRVLRCLFQHTVNAFQPLISLHDPVDPNPKRIIPWIEHSFTIDFSDRLLRLKCYNSGTVPDEFDAGTALCSSLILIALSCFSAQ